MCGIIGFTGRQPEGNTLRKMLTMIAHRGPDDEGVYEDDWISLGHKRLSVIDTQHGNQPIASLINVTEEGRVKNYDGQSEY